MHAKDFQPIIVHLKRKYKNTSKEIVYVKNKFAVVLLKYTTENMNSPDGLSYSVGMMNRISELDYVLRQSLTL